VKLNLIFLVTSFIPVIVFKVIARVGEANLAQAKVATVVGLTLALIQFILAKRYLKHVSYLEWAFLGYLAFGTAWVYLAPNNISSFFVDNSIAILYFVLLLTALIPQLFGYDPFSYAVAKRFVAERVWKTPQFRTINLHLTYFWSGILFVCFLSSWLGHGKPLFSIVIPLAIILSVGIPVSRFYPNYYLKRQYRSQPLDRSLFPDTAKELIVQMPLGFDPAVGKGLEADIQFDLSGEGGGKIVLSVSKGQCRAWEGEAASPTLTICSPADVWLKVARREINPGMALINGLYHAEGDMELLVKMSQLFHSPGEATKYKREL
jgi:putative sterol carrier protein